MAWGCYDATTQVRDGCDRQQPNSVFYFVTSIVALLILTSVIMFCVCCLCIKRRRFLTALHNRTGFGLPPGMGPNGANVPYVGPAFGGVHGDIEEGRIAAGAPRKGPELAVIMPGEAAVTFIAEPSSPIRVVAKDRQPEDVSADPSTPDSPAPKGSS